MITVTIMVSTNNIDHFEDQMNIHFGMELKTLNLVDYKGSKNNKLSFLYASTSPIPEA